MDRPQTRSNQPGNLAVTSGGERPEARRRPVQTSWAHLALRERLSLVAIRYGLLLIFLVFFTVMSFVGPYFLTGTNFLNVLRQTAPVLIIAIGMTFVIATAGIDLSVGSTVALISVLTAGWLRDGFTAWPVVLVALAVGAVVGAANGYFIAFQQLPAFVVTLASLSLVRGLAFVYTNGYTIPIPNETFNSLGRGQIGPIHTPIVIAAVVVTFGHFFLTRTRFGRYCLAIGGHEEAARRQGIRVKHVKLWVYVVTGVLAALSGVILTGRVANGSPNVGVTLELEVITAVVLGGTSLFGGEATIGGTVVGALLINFIRNGLNLLGVNPFAVWVATGVILLIAIYLNVALSRRVEDWLRTRALQLQEEAR